MGIVLVVVGLALLGHVAIGWFIWSRVRKASAQTPAPLPDKEEP